jgi:hypothetical protein
LLAVLIAEFLNRTGIATGEIRCALKLRSPSFRN